MKQSVRYSPCCIFTLFLISIFCRCAYFNTYYNAETAFKAARTAHLLVPNADTLSILPADIQTNYKRAIEKSGLVAVNYPRQRRWLDDALFLTAKSYYYIGERLKAIRKFTELQTEFPGSPFVPESYLFVARAYMKEDLVQKSEETIAFIREQYPDLDKKGEVTRLIAELSLKQGNSSAAIAQLEKLLAEVTSNHEKLDILIQLAGLYMDLGLFEKTIALLRQAPQDEKQPEKMYRVDYLMLCCQIETNAFDQAFSLADRMIENRTYKRHTADILFKKGATLKKKNMTADAIKIFIRITKEFDTSAVAGLAWFELGLLFQEKVGDLTKAGEYYHKADSLLKSGPIKEQAAQRSLAIAELKKLMVVKKDTADTAKMPDSLRFSTEFKRGEIFWLSLSEPDSAVSHFSKIATDTAASAEDASRALYASAWIVQHISGDSARADTLYSALITKYPVSEYSKKAQQELGRKVTISTRCDSALDLYERADNILVDNNDTVRAVDTLLFIYRTWPMCDAGAKALYYAAWINDILYNKNVTANTLYKQLCTECPNSAYCLEGAKPRLKAVEDSIRTLKAIKEGKNPATAQSTPTTDTLQTPPMNPRMGRGYSGPKDSAGTMPYGSKFQPLGGPGSRGGRGQMDNP